MFFWKINANRGKSICKIILIALFYYSGLNLLAQNDNEWIVITNQPLIDSTNAQNFMEFEYKGKKDSGKDEVDVRLINGRWTITSVPT